MSSPNPQDIATASAGIMDIISKAQQMDKVQALLKLLEIEDKDITITGEKHKVLNLELITEYLGKEMTKFMVKNETYRRTIQDVYHYADINDEKLIGYMDTQVILKMISHKRKRAHEIINGLRDALATQEVIPQNQKRKRFLGFG